MAEAPTRRTAKEIIAVSVNNIETISFLSCDVGWTLVSAQHCTPKK
jgi:hypothetical protein